LIFPPSLVGKGVRGLGFTLAFPHNVKSQTTLSFKITILSLKVTILSFKITILSLKATTLSLKVTTLSLKIKTIALNSALNRRYIEAIQRNHGHKSKNEQNKM